MASKGLTFLELLITLVIAAIVLSAALPGFQHLYQRHIVTSAQHRLLTSLHHARSEAVQRRRPVMVCQGRPADGCDKGNAWHEGWFSARMPRGVHDCQDADGDNECDTNDGTIISRQPGLPDGITIRGNGKWLISRIRFNPAGMAEGYAGTLSICPNYQEDITGSGIVINISGRLRKAEASDLNC